ncbi:hypothetical protein [Rhodococcus sp. IEGM 1318]|uniref:phage tail fiber protein n=1 Tax=Rhodococcus sp. IEGM 1318 TaxID=3082226 RepID=UPI00295576BC|nr:hypothetical protein [Rhodococcus sp. IEGM 1318]MDV8005060.1 hypothetical protein [Rhodococcus sp. IEGM 1318]
MALVCPVATANSTATSAAALGSTFGLHTGSPGPAGTANEATGGSYARQTATPGTAALGVVAWSQMTFPVAANTYTHMTRWNGSTLVEVIDNLDIIISPSGEAKVNHKVTIPYALPA